MVNMNILWHTLKMKGFPRHLLRVLQSLYAGTNIIIENSGTRNNQGANCHPPFLSLLGPSYNRVARKCRFFKNEIVDNIPICMHMTRWPSVLQNTPLKTLY